MRADCHIHIAFSGRELNENFCGRDAGAKEMLEKILIRYKSRGIDALRDGGDNRYISYHARNIAEEKGILFKTPVAAFSKKSKYGSFLGVSIDTITDFKKEFRSIMKYRPDFLKIILSDIIRFDKDEKVEIFFDREELYYMINTARDKGIKSMVHVNSPEGIELAVKCGADTIEHGYYLNYENIESMKENKTIFVPTLSPIENYVKYGKPDEALGKRIENIIENHKEKIKEAYLSGVDIAVGSDAGAMYVFHENAYEDEIEYMTENIEDKVDFFEKMKRSTQKIFE